MKKLIKHIGILNKKPENKTDSILGEEMLKYKDNILPYDCSIDLFKKIADAPLPVKLKTIIEIPKLADKEKFYQELDEIIFQMKKVARANTKVVDKIETQYANSWGKYEPIHNKNGRK